MAKRVATLCLGTRPDSQTWNKGCEALGFSVVASVAKPDPSDEELAAIFASDAEWLYLGGHFGARTLTNEKENIDIRFEAGAVHVLRDNKLSVSFDKGSGFALHKTCKLTLWGGCDVCTGGATIRTLRSLFDNPVILGFAGLTGWKVADAMLGGGFLRRKHFFNNVRGSVDDSAGQCEAWMEAAQAGYSDSSLESLFRAVDIGGQEWKLVDGKIVQGRKL